MPPVMAAGVWNIVIEQGGTFSNTVTWKDGSGVAVNLTGYTARMQIRKNPDSFVTLVEITTENGGITLGGAAGTIALLITAAVTATLPAGPAKYDLELISGSTVTKLLKGDVSILPEVTR
jgi:hypothetical protein